MEALEGRSKLPRAHTPGGGGGLQWVAISRHTPALAPSRRGQPLAVLHCSTRSAARTTPRSSLKAPLSRLPPLLWEQEPTRPKVASGPALLHKHSSRWLAQRRLEGLREQTLARKRVPIHHATRSRFFFFSQSLGAMPRSPLFVTFGISLGAPEDKFPVCRCGI